MKKKILIALFEIRQEARSLWPKAEVSEQRLQVFAHGPGAKNYKLWFIEVRDFESGTVVSATHRNRSKVRRLVYAACTRA